MSKIRKAGSDLDREVDRCVFQASPTEEAPPYSTNEEAARKVGARMDVLGWDLLAKSSQVAKRRTWEVLFMKKGTYRGVAHVSLDHGSMARPHAICIAALLALQPAGD